MSEPRYDVAISFARSQRDYARAIQQALFLRGISCFFDEVQQVQLWGQDLAERFDEVFRKDAQFCIACVSQEWVDRVWPAHERRSALARAVQEPGYLLPIRFDDAEVPGLSPSVAYLNGNEIESEEMASLIAQKLANRRRNAYLPPIPNRVFAAVEIAPEDEEGESRTLDRCMAFLSDLEEMTPQARNLVTTVLRYGCPCSLPDEVHMPVDRLRRISNWEMEAVQETVQSLRKMAGFSASFRPINESEDLLLAIGWEPMAVGAPQGEATDVANAMVREARFGRCDHCYEAALERLDFSGTSSMLDWSSDETEQFDAMDSPPALRDLVELLLDEGWQLEVAADQLRFLEPGSTSFETVSLADRHDQELLEAAREDLQALIGSHLETSIAP